VTAPARGSTVRAEVLIDTLDSGGAEFLLADFAAVAAGAGIELSVTSLKPLTPPVPAAERLRRVGLEPGAVPVTSMVSPREVARVRRHLARRRPDIVHTHLTTADFLGGVASRSLSIPCVTTIHADWFDPGTANRGRQWLTARARRHCATTVVAVSESARNAYLIAGSDSPAHVVVVRNGILDRARPGVGAGLRRELGLGDDEFVLTALSKLRPEKNFEAAIDAVALLRSQHPRTRLVIVGDGPHEAAVRAHAARLGDAVVMTGHRDDTMAVLDASDVLVHPSHFDALPTTLLEAMAASVPVVATGVGGMLEIIEPGVSGILFGPPPTGRALADAVELLLEDPGLRSRLASAGRARYEREFEAAAWARRLRAVYDEALSRGADQPPG